VSKSHPSLSTSTIARRSITATNVFLRTQLWAWPLFAAVLLGGIGYGLRTSIERAVRESMEGHLQAILDADVSALRIWLETQRSNAETAASAERVGHLARELIEMAHQPEFKPVLVAQSPQLSELRTAIRPWMDSHGFTDFIVIDREKQIVAASQEELIGRQELTRAAVFFDTALAGQATVSRPFPSRILLTDEDGEVRVNLPTMFAVAPLRDDSHSVIGALALRLRPERDFTRILNVARFGRTGETFAFGPTGLLLSQSRFDDDLKRIGLLPDQDDAHSILTLELRNPSVDMTKGARPKIRRSEQPLTKLAAEAIAGHSGVDVDGYRDYRGVLSLGAWTWLPEYEFGVGTEVDFAEAYRPTAFLRMAYWGMFTLLALSTAAIFAFTVVVARLRRAMRQATVEAKRLGQYTLEEKLGEGGMGVVYRGRHARLQRPTAIKLLDVEKTTPESIRRFEREVQLTSQLNHANTVAIYDFGSTPEGVFYYAMEFLEGINLEQLVLKHGPQPEGRVIRILLQICGSLHEAHGMGLVHRDIKPANIILTCRGGVADFVKVLDFGLAKVVSVEREAGLTAFGSIIGTPLYLAPEAVQGADDLDARGDLYAVGAVGYFLLTGTTVFKGQNIVELLMHQVNTPPETPSARLGAPISQDLEAVILQCLAKRRDDRPASARELADALAQCTAAADWSEADAEGWWQAHAADRSPENGTAPAPTTPVLAEARTAIWKGER